MFFESRDIRIFYDLDSGEAHCLNHGVQPAEAIEIIRRPLRIMPTHDGKIMAEGQTARGRYLRAIYCINDEDDSIFLITSYDLPEKAKRALRRRGR